MNTLRRALTLSLMLILFLHQPAQTVQSRLLNASDSHKDFTEPWVTWGKNAQRQSTTSEYLIPPFQERWSIEFPYTDNLVVPIPIAAKGMLFVVVKSANTEKSLLALSPQTGEIIWYKGIISGAYFQSAAYDQTTDRLFAATNYEILVFDPDDGTQLDRIGFPKPGSCGVFGLIVYEGSLYGSICDLVVKYSLDGTIIWTFLDPLNDFGFGMTPPVLGDGLLFVGGPNSTLYALNQKSGSEVWHSGTPGKPSGGIVYGDGMVFIGCVGTPSYPPSPVVLALNAHTGEVLWGAYTGFGGSVYASMSYHEGVLFFGSLDQFIYAIDTRSRKVLWSTETPNDVYGNIVVADEIVYASSMGPHTLFAFERASGKILWQTTFDWPIWHIMPYEGFLFLTSGLNLFGLESSPALQDLRVSSPAPYIRFGQPGQFQISFKSSYNYPNAPVELLFSPIPAGMTITTTPANPSLFDQITVTVSCTKEFTFRGIYLLTIEANVEQKHFTKVILLNIHDHSLYLPMTVQ